MAHGVGKHQLLVIGPTEPWSVREKLCLAASVMKSGDKNWYRCSVIDHAQACGVCSMVSVSRAIKPFAEPGRPPDWFSHKHCASKYSELLETTEAPTQKRGDGGEAAEPLKDAIVRRLTADRIDALRKLIKDTQAKHRKLKREAELIQAGCLDSKLEELWGDILQKKELEEKEAELKRKNTNAAYQARQAAKNTSKPKPCIPVHSPSGCSPPGQMFPPGDPLECWTLDLPSMENPSGAARSTTISEASGPGNEDVSPGSLPDDPTQRKLLSQKATPPPSPLLSELLKKGSILATHSRRIGEGDVTTANMTGAHDLQLAPPSQPLTQATGAPMLSRLLEAGPARFSAPLGFVAVGDPASGAPLPAAATPVSVDSTASANTERSLAPGSRPICAEDRVAALGRGDVTVSYVGDELDLKTVGDIIAIIEEKTDVTAEALDAAAVEAALSLSEENGRALSGAWGPAPFCPHGSLPTGVQRASSLHRSPKGRIPLAVTLKREKRTRQRPGPPHGDSLLEDSPLAARRPKGTRAEDGGGDSASGTRARDNEADGCSPEPEPAGAGLSGSEDGQGLHAASSSSSSSSSSYSSSLRLCVATDSAPSSPASSQFSVCSEDHESLQAHKIWKKAIMLVWRAAANHRYANVFLQPVTDDIAPGYHGIVQRPTDLAAIKKSIETGSIRNTAEFQRDIMLMFQNAVMYNSLDHDVYHMAVEMQRDVLEQIQQFLATQLIMEASEAGISAKSLRGRERTRKPDAPDKDTVSMSSPAFLLSLFDGGTRGRRCTIEADLKMKK